MLQTMSWTRRTRWHRSLLGVTLSLAACMRGVHGDDAAMKPGVNPLAPPTLGGKQFWGDVLLHGGWRIQQNVFTKHYRLLDPRQRRHVSGDYDACRERFDELRQQGTIPPMKKRVVILIHGILRSGASMGPLGPKLARSGYEPVLFDYPSTRVTIAESAEYLHRVIENMEEAEEISFVVHSMGGLVVRAYLAEHEDERIQRIAMLGVPNHGAEMATLLKDLSLFRTIFGVAGQQLVDGPESYIARLPTPQCQFAIVAGARGRPEGFNPLIPGDDDGTVTVASARLAGACDFMTVKAPHAFLMNNPQVIASVDRFLRTGALREDGTRRPIEPDDAPVPMGTAGAAE